MSASDPFSLDEDLSALLPPTAVALVKGAWSKFVTFDELMVELFFEQAPGRTRPASSSSSVLAIDAAPQELLRLIDISVRALDPRTENMLKEGYRGPRRSAAGAAARRADCAAVLSPAHDVSRAQWELARDAFLWTFRKIPHLDDMEREDLGAGRRPALAQFFDEAIVEPMLGLRRVRGRLAFGPDVARDGGVRRADARPAQEAGTFFYERVFSEHPAALQFFRTSDSMPRRIT